MKTSMTDIMKASFWTTSKPLAMIVAAYSAGQPANEQRVYKSQNL
jgi:hypothetical protein